MAAGPDDPFGVGTHAASGASPPLEDVVADFIFRREEGENPNLDEYLARYPRHAEELARALGFDTLPPVTRREPPPPGATAGTRAADGGTIAGPTAPHPERGDLTVLGPYKIDAHVSTAGGGTVYRARHVAAGHTVALKVLDSRGAIDPRDQMRFRREAEVLRALNLVNVVPVMETGEEGGRWWMAMKWIDGENVAALKDHVKAPTHRLHDVRERARFIARVARTFAAIHEHGVLHRDIKPSNIMVDRTGEPAIIDFGIARAPNALEGGELTMTGDGVLGTPRYLAPELLKGGNSTVAATTDIYGLGLVLYELVTGTTAFTQKERGDLFQQIRSTGPTHPSLVAPGISADLAAVILRAIEIDPARRYPTMTAFAEDLEAIARDLPPDPTTRRRAHPFVRFVHRRKRELRVAVLLAIPLAVALGMIWGLKIAPELQARSLAAQVEPFLWFPPEAWGDVAGLPVRQAKRLAELSPDGAERRGLAAWVIMAAGDIDRARVSLGDEPLDHDSVFAVALIRAQLRASFNRAERENTEIPGTIIDATVGEPWETQATPVVPMRDVSVNPAVLLGDFADISARLPIVTATDHAVAAAVLWALLPSAPERRAEDSGATVLAQAEAAISDPVAAPAMTYIRGCVRLRNGDFGGARADFGRVVALQPRAIGARYLQGVACRHLGDLSAARDHLAAAAVALGATHRVLPRVLGNLAVTQRDLGDIPGALATCERWRQSERLGRWQSAALPRVLAARMLTGLGRGAEAVPLLRAAIEANPSWDIPYGELITLLKSQGDSAGAGAVAAARAIEPRMRFPTDVEPYLDYELSGMRPPDRDLVMISADAFKPGVDLNLVSRPASRTASQPTSRATTR